MKKILKFYSKTCGPCKVMTRELAKLKGVEIQEIDAMDPANSPLIEGYNIRTVPTIVVLSEGGYPIALFVGITPIEKIQAVIDGRQTATA